MPFLSLFCLIVLTRHPILYWIEVVRAGILILFLFLRECFQLLPVQYDVSWVFVIDGSFYFYFEACSFYAWFLEGVFIMKRCWILLKDFFASIEVLFLILFMWWITPTWLWWTNFWCAHQFGLLAFCLVCLHLYSSGILACGFLFSLCLCPALGSTVTLPS